MRHCVLCRQSAPRDALVRLVRAPDGRILPDLAERLPGRGVWIHASRDKLEAAIGRRRLVGALAHGFRQTVRPSQIEPDLVGTIERGLRQRVLGRIGMARRRGVLATGFDPVRAALRGGRAAVVLLAADAGTDGRAKISALAEAAGVPLIDFFRREELSLALGRANVVHAALEDRRTGLAWRRDLDRLAAWLGKSRPMMGSSEDVRGSPDRRCA